MADACHTEVIALTGRPAPAWNRQRRTPRHARLRIHTRPMRKELCMMMNADPITPDPPSTAGFDREGVPVASVQETTICRITVKSAEGNEGLLPHRTPTKTPGFLPVYCCI
jgi:hypothetical protein